MRCFGLVLRSPKWQGTNSQAGRKFGLFFKGDKMLYVKLEGQPTVSFHVEEAEFRPPGRDSLCPSGAAFVSTMPRPFEFLVVGE